MSPPPAGHEATAGTHPPSGRLPATPQPPLPGSRPAQYPAGRNFPAGEPFVNTLSAHAPLVHQGRTGTMVRLALSNLLLNVITLSLWRFWGKTRVRRQLWADTVIWGDAAEYTGTGRELLLGFLVALIAVFSPLLIALGAAQAAVEAGNGWAGLAVFLIQMAMVVLAAAGLYRARRYQLSRTVWRGIRGGQGGEAWRYGLKFLGVSFSTFLTLGWALPWAEMTLARYRWANTTFGDCRFDCDATARPLYKRFAALWLSGVMFLVGIALVIGAFWTQLDDPDRMVGLIAAGYALALPWALLTIAVPFAWYRAGFLRHLVARTRFDGVSFALDATTGSLMRLAFGNWLISLLSLGALRPWAAQRTFRYVCAHLRPSAEPVWERVHQSTAQRSRTGEGLAAVFDGAGEF